MQISNYLLSDLNLKFLFPFFLIQAARQSDPSPAQQPYGPWILGIVAIGLVAYGIHNMVEARYRRIITA